MKKGTILKIRLGHEANCSSGMVAMAILMVAAYTHFPLTVITGIVQAVALERGRPRSQWHVMYWIVPQMIGLCCTAILVWLSVDHIYGNPGWLTVMALVIGGSYAAAVTIGYFWASRTRYGILAPLIVPATFVLGYVLFCIIASILTV